MGNSYCLTTAKEASKYFDHCQVISITSLKDISVIVDKADTVGFVFPIYYSQMPYLVKEALLKLNFVNDPYIFILTTCRGHNGNIAVRMNALLKEKRLISFSC